MSIVNDLGSQVGIKCACEQLGVPRSRVYRATAPASAVRPTPTHALSEEERITVRDTLNSERFMDQSPRQVYATLLDEDQYLCHWRTMYRILAAYDEVRERRAIGRRPVYKKPELLATSPNQVWSWDITMLRGPAKWVHYALYTVLDIFSRYVVGWLVAEVESGELAAQLIAQTTQRQGIQAHQLTLHADNGAPMKSKTLKQLLSDLDITGSHSRPYTSDDNPFSEAHFKTMKYRPDYPDRFASLDMARQWARPFFDWYNHQHYHSALNLLTPACVHYGRAAEVQTRRQTVMLAAFQAHPDRFVQGVPVVKGAPQAVWINPPAKKENLL